MISLLKVDSTVRMNLTSMGPVNMGDGEAIVKRILRRSERLESGNMHILVNRSHFKHDSLDALVWSFIYPSGIQGNPLGKGVAITI